MVAAQCFCIGGRERERPLERLEWGRFTPDEEEEERGLRYSKSECLKIYKDFFPHICATYFYPGTNENCRQRYSKSSIVTNEQIQSLRETISKMIIFILVIFIIY